MIQNAYKSCEVKFKVPFHDLDPLQIVWHGNYLKYFDITRFALFEESGVDFYEYVQTSQYIFPITRWSVKHIVPLRHKDEFICKATVTEAKFKIVMNFEIRLSETNIICTKAKSDQVAVKVPKMDIQFEIPHEISKALGFE